MALSKKEQEARTRKELAQKLRLEAGMIPKLRAFFSHMDVQFRLTYLESATIMSAESFEPELLAIIGDQFRRTVRVFGHNVRDEVKSYSHLKLEYKQSESTIEEAFRQFITTTSLIHAAFITQTTNKIYNFAVQKAIVEMTLAGEEVTRESVAKRAYEIARVQNLPRANNIAATTTQNAAEGAKQVELEALVKARSTINGIPIRDTTEKEWNTVLDSHARIAHVVADGQRVAFDEAFIVDGELLMFPGDISHGASAKNTNHCRCGSQHVLSEFMLSSEQVDIRARDFSQFGSPVV